jgi:signal transduction histidine kinase
VTVASAGIYLLITGLVSPPASYDLVRLATRPVAILGLGLILAYWGGAEIALKKKLALLNELSVLANPRFGVDWTIELILQRLLAFWDASQCLILLTHDAEMSLYLISKDDPTRFRKVPVRDQSDLPFIDISDPASLVYNEQARPWTGNNSLRSYDARTNVIAVRPPAPGEALAEFLAAHSFVSVPLRYRERIRGRIMVSSSRSWAFDVADAVFLQQVANQALPVIENIRLVERLASDASDEERNRIARSVHDCVIQPYYGLQMGLQALHNALQSKTNGNGSSNGADKEAGALIGELMAMTSDGIDKLRQYISGLRHSRSRDVRLADSIRRFAAKFEHATGIHVKVTDGTEGFSGNERVTSEVFQMAAEALSNVHRHTHARTARVILNLSDGAIQLNVENDRNGDSEPRRFTPGSISDRAQALGGRAEVFLEEDRTILSVQVPL